MKKAKRTILSIYENQKRSDQEKRKAYDLLLRSGSLLGECLTETSDSIILNDTHVFRYLSMGAVCGNSLRGVRYDVIIVDDHVNLMKYDTDTLFTCADKVQIQGDGYIKDYKDYTTTSMKGESVIVETKSHKYKYRSAEIACRALSESYGHSRDTRMMMKADIIYDKTTKRFIKDRYIGQEKANEYLDFIGK